jgi:hypothetical protein
MATRVIAKELKEKVSILYGKPVREQKLYAKRIQEMLDGDDFDRALEDGVKAGVFDKMAKKALKDRREGKTLPLETLWNQK